MKAEKISKALEAVLDQGEQSLICFKTAWRPTYGTPTLWLSATDRRLLFFSTLRGGTIFFETRFNQINAIVTDQGSRLVKVLFWDPQTEDLNFSVDASVAPDHVKKLLEEVRMRLTDSGGSSDRR
jgi:hypothetical protein